MQHHTRHLPVIPAALLAALTLLTPARADTANTDTPPEPSRADAASPDTPPSPEPAEDTHPHARPFTDFSDDDHNDRWRSVNDNVMGGRSLGDFAFDDGIMTFTGSINTNGGGFASVRFQLDPNTLTYTPDTTDDSAADGEQGVEAADPIPFTRIQLRIKTDGRPYRLLLADDTRYQRRTISHRALLSPPPPPAQDQDQPPDAQPTDTDPAAPDDDGWQTVTLDLDDLTPSWRGRLLPDAPPLDPARATTIGITLVDDVDGPFALRIESITFLP